MLNDKRPVFILEAPGPDEIVRGRSEADLLEKSLRLHEIPAIVFKVMCDNDMRTAIRVFRQLSPRLLHVSGHGSSKGDALILTDGTHWKWPRLLKQLSFTHETSYLFASACHSLTGGYLLAAFEAAGIQRPKAVLGFESSISWTSSALASILVYQALDQDSHADIYAAMLGAYLSLSVDLIAYFVDGTAAPRRASGSSLLDEFARSLIARDRVAFEYLVSARGLLAPEKWTRWWDESDENKRNLEHARAAVEANPIAKAAIERAAPERAE